MNSKEEILKKHYEAIDNDNLHYLVSYDTWKKSLTYPAILNAMQEYAASNASQSAPLSEEWKKALVSLTPGGSEFADDYENCVRHIRERFENNHKLTAEAIKQKKELINELRDWKDIAADWKKCALEAEAQLQSLKQGAALPEQIGYTDAEIAEIETDGSPLEKAAWKFMKGYEPRDVAVIVDREWPTYDQYTVLEMLCNFWEAAQGAAESEGQPDPYLQTR